MNLDEARTILLRYTDWLKGRGNLHYLEHTPLPDFIERFFQEARPPEIRPDAPNVVICSHIAKDEKLVYAQLPLGDLSLRVCHGCYNAIQGDVMEGLIQTALKDWFGEWRESRRKTAPPSNPFIG